MSSVDATDRPGRHSLPPGRPGRNSITSQPLPSSRDTHPAEAMLRRLHVRNRRRLWLTAVVALSASIAANVAEEAGLVYASAGWATAVRVATGVVVPVILALAMEAVLNRPSDPRPADERRLLGDFGRTFALVLVPCFVISSAHVFELALALGWSPVLAVALVATIDGAALAAILESHRSSAVLSWLDHRAVVLAAEGEQRAEVEAAEALAREQRRASRAKGKQATADVETAIADHLAEHLTATKDEVASAVGCSARTVQRSAAWKSRIRPGEGEPREHGLEVVV